MSQSASTGVIVIGARGRLGRFAIEVLARQSDLHLAHAIAHGDIEHEDLKSALAARLGRAPATLALEATKAGLGAAHARVLLEAGLRPVVATSGVTPEEVRALDRFAREQGIGGLVVPNFSLGIWLLQRFALEARKLLPAVEIIERHHEDKYDAPSGTALAIARQLQAGGNPAVPIHSVRLPGLYAQHEVQLGAAGETLTLRHDMLGPEGFEAGILLALRHAKSAEGIQVGIGCAL